MKLMAKLSTINKNIVKALYVVAGLTKGLLSRSVSVAIGLVMRVLTVSSTTTQSVKQQFPNLFSGLGRIQGEYKIEIKEDAKPFPLSTPRRVPLPLLLARSDLQSGAANRLVCRDGPSTKTR